MITQINKTDYADKAKTEPENLVTEQVIGCCYEVHNQLGPGFPEKVYQRALVITLQTAGLKVEEERYFDVTFQGQTVGEFRADLLVDDKVIVEVKAIPGLLPSVHMAQVVAYLRAAGRRVGLLVNFGNVSCQVKRVVNSKQA